MARLSRAAFACSANALLSGLAAAAAVRRSAFARALDRLLPRRPRELEHDQHLAWQLAGETLARFGSGIAGSGVETQGGEPACVQPRRTASVQRVAVVGQFLVGIEDAPVQRQRQAAVLRVAVTAGRQCQLAFAEHDAAFRFIGPVPGDARQSDGVGQQNQRHTGGERTPACPGGHRDSPGLARLLTPRSRLRTNRISTALRPRTKKKRYLGMTSQHQS